MPSSPVSLALGRIFAMMSHPYEPGDEQEYERCRALIMDELAPVTPPPVFHSPRGQDVGGPLPGARPWYWGP